MLQGPALPASERVRTTWLWLLGLPLLLVAATVALVLYLQTFEAEENDRRRLADAQWLQQSMRFHFQRLENDLAAMAHQHLEGGARTKQTNATGLLWRAPDVILAEGWLAKDARPNAAAWPQSLTR